jgi:hypothetical protein
MCNVGQLYLIANGLPGPIRFRRRRKAHFPRNAEGCRNSSADKPVRWQKNNHRVPAHEHSLQMTIVPAPNPLPAQRSQAKKTEASQKVTAPPSGEASLDWRSRIKHSHKLHIL